MCLLANPNSSWCIFFFLLFSRGVQEEYYSDLNLILWLYHCSNYNGLLCCHKIGYYVYLTINCYEEAVLFDSINSLLVSCCFLNKLLVNFILGSNLLIPYNFL